MTDDLDDIRDFLRFLRGVLGSGRAPLAHAVRTCPAYAAWLAMHERCPHCKSWVPFVPAKDARGLLSLIEHRGPDAAVCMGSEKKLRKTGSRPWGVCFKNVMS